MHSSTRETVAKLGKQQIWEQSESYKKSTHQFQSTTWNKKIRTTIYEDGQVLQQVQKALGKYALKHKFEDFSFVLA